MPLTQTECQLVRESLTTAAIEELFLGSTRFYDRLFALDPSLRALFREDLEGQGMRFMSTLRTILDALGEDGGADAMLVELAQSHRRMGIRAGMFDTMGAALIDTMEELLKDRFTPELAAAWRKAYAHIAEKMVSAGGIEAA